MIYKAKNDIVKLKNGRFTSINRPLIEPTSKPIDGWLVETIIKSQKTKIIKNSPRKTVNELIRIHSLSGETISENDAWLTSNIQWINRLSSITNSLVEISELNKLVSKFPEEKLAPSKKRRDYVPSDFGGKGWHTMQYCLAQDDYKHLEFLDLCRNHVLKWLDPIRNNSIGCSECHAHFLEALSDLSRKYHSLKDAQEWLFNLHNSVNKRVGKEVIIRESYWSKNNWV